MLGNCVWPLTSAVCSKPSEGWLPGYHILKSFGSFKAGFFTRSNVVGGVHLQPTSARAPHVLAC